MVRDDDSRHSTRFAMMSAAIALCLAACPVSAQEFRGPFAAAVEGLTSEVSGKEEEDEHIETDRDSFTPATTLVGRGRVMIEGSYSFIDNRVGPENHSYPELLTRVGLTDWFELRLGWNYEAGGGGAVSGGEVGGDEETGVFERESKMLYGFKVAVTDQDMWLPRSALIAHATTPTSGENTATQFVLGYVAGWTLPNKWDLDSSARYIAASEEGDHFNQWAPTIVLKVPLGEHWNAHAEYFGIFSDGQAKNVNPQYFSPGVHYLITPDCEIGTRVGWGLNDDAADFFSNVGLGFRF